MTELDPASVLARRRDEAFPVLLASEIERLRRFGQLRSYAPGDVIAKAGTPIGGLVMVLSGQIDVTAHSLAGRGDLIVAHRAGGFLGELTELSGRPTFVDARAHDAVEALVIAPDRVRAVLVEEVELGEGIMRALILRRMGLLEVGSGGLILIGDAEHGGVLRLQDFLRRNGQPHQVLNPELDADARALVDRFELGSGDLPIVLCPNGQLLRNPNEFAVATCLGLLLAPIDPERVYDVVIVGAGPAGLAASVYAASEGLSVLVLDCRAFGGQAGASARIENYLGFPTGITGMALMARAYNQAQKFGVEMAIPSEALRLECADSNFKLRLSEDQQVNARAVVIATGARYRRPNVEGLDSFEGTSVHYWASPVEARLCGGQEVALVGGGNSAGQAAVYLASQASKVWLIIRGPDLASGMSRYLVDRISSLGNVQVLTNTRLTALEGSDGILQAVRWQSGTKDETRRAMRHLFLFIGAEPNTDWLAGSGVGIDQKGFVLTGGALDRGSLETSRRNIFAIGDVRSGSTKRVASAVGEGAQVVALLHRSGGHGSDRAVGSKLRLLGNT